VLVSPDAGWQAFADQSSFLFCVKTIEEFTALFEASDEKSKAVTEKVANALNDPTSKLFGQLSETLSQHVQNSEWSVNDIYSGYSLRVEGDVYNAALNDFDVDETSVSLWFPDHDPSVCVVELAVTVHAKVDVEAKFYQWDSIDRDEISAGSDEVAVESDIEVSVFLNCEGRLIEDEVNEWDTNFEIAFGQYEVDVGEINPDYGEEYEE
jgi:hypothetical protein